MRKAMMYHEGQWLKELRGTKLLRRNIMNYHGITHTSFNNGEGMRVVLWVAGCEHHCKGCQNAFTWDENGGKPFDRDARLELFRALNRTWIDGITFSGGDPLHQANRDAITELAKDFKAEFPKKTIWLYTGYTYEDVKDLEVMQYVDVVVDGKFVEELASENHKYAGSTNQRVICKGDKNYGSYMS